MTDPMTDPNFTDLEAALNALATAMQTAAGEDADAARAAREKLPALRRAVDAAREADADPDPPEPAPPELLPDLAAVNAALLHPDGPTAWLAQQAKTLGAHATDAEALRRVLRLGHRDEAACPKLVTAAERELDRMERAARRLERVAGLDIDARPRVVPRADGTPGMETDADVAARVKTARSTAQQARGAGDDARTKRAVVTGARHAESLTDWTGAPTAREWLLQGWLAVGRVHLLTGSGGRGKSRLALQLAAALAAGGGEHPVPWRTADERRTALPGRVDHPPTLPPVGADGLPVVVASWEDEADEVRRRLHDGPVPVEALADRLHYVDAAEWGPLWAPEQGSRHVQTVAELTGAGRRLRRLCERVHARLLVVDPLAAAYASDENVRGLVRQFMASWDAWGRSQRCAVLMIAHPPKQAAGGGGEDNWWSGSTDWPAAARSAWALRHQTAREKSGNNKAALPERTWLQCVKPNYGMAPEPVDLAAEGVTWYATWPPPPKAPGKPNRTRTANDAGTVPAENPY